MNVNNARVLINVLMLLFVVGSQVFHAYAIDFDDLDDPLSSREMRSLERMFQPVVKLFSLAKYLGSIVAAVFIAWGAINLMGAGDNFKKREDAKSKITFAVIGFGILWAIPIFLEFMFEI